MPTLEKSIEAYLVREVKKIGGVAEKFTSPNRRSVPDRIVWLPKVATRQSSVTDNGDGTATYTSRRLSHPAECIFVELKAPGKKPTEAQERDHEKRRAMGFRVEVIDTKEGVDSFIRSVA